jgi:hypothetical protein
MLESRKMGWVGHIAYTRKRRGVNRIFMGNPKGKKPLGKSRRGWEGNIKMKLQAMRCEGMDVIELAQDRDRWRAFVNAIMNLQVPYSTGKFLTR